MNDGTAGAVWVPVGLDVGAETLPALVAAALLFFGIETLQPTATLTANTEARSEEAFMTRVLATVGAGFYSVIVESGRSLRAIAGRFEADFVVIEGHRAAHKWLPQ